MCAGGLRDLLLLLLIVLEEFHDIAPDNLSDAFKCFHCWVTVDGVRESDSVNSHFVCHVHNPEAMCMNNALDVHIVINILIIWPQR